MAANYAALVTLWGTLPGGDTTAQKLALVNAQTVTGSVPTTLYTTGAQLLNCINYAEFKALTTTQQANLMALCSNPGPLLGGSANTAFMAAGMILDYFTNHAGPTMAALTALAQAAVQPWWQANGFQGPIGTADLVLAGNLT
jgi:hypothetical protein